MAQTHLPSGKASTQPTFSISEFDEAHNLVATYTRPPPLTPFFQDSDKPQIEIHIPKSSTGYAKNILNAFLPAGYPHSVTGDYLEYQIYDSLQAFSSSIAGMLSSRAVLEGIGVGDSHASPTSALLLTVLQESMGRIATILFAHRLGTSLEPECKMYRLAADIFNDAAMILDCLSPGFPKVIRVGILAGSSILRSLCGVAAGSSKASLSAHFATQGNLGELNAKDSSQETVISLLGMLAGTIVVSQISSQWATWTSLLFLLAVHLWTNYMAVRAVCMRTLNRQRANLVFSDILNQLESRAALKTRSPEQWEDQKVIDLCFAQIKIPTPEDIYRQERVFERDGILRFQKWEEGPVGYCRLGVSLQTLLEAIEEPKYRTSAEITQELNDLMTRFQSSESEGRSLFEEEGYSMALDRRSNTFLILLAEGATPRNMCHAWLQALQASQILAVYSQDFDCKPELEFGRLVIDNIFPEIWRRLGENGWDLEVNAMETKSGTRISLRKG